MSGKLAQIARERARNQQRRLDKSSMLLPLETYKNPVARKMPTTPQVKPKPLLPVNPVKRPKSGAFDSAEDVFRSLKGGRR